MEEVEVIIIEEVMIMGEVIIIASGLRPLISSIDFNQPKIGNLKIGQKLDTASESLTFRNTIF